MTIKETIRKTKGADTQSLRRVMEHVLNITSSELIINMNKEIEQRDLDKFHMCVEQLKQGKPLQYITKCQEFMGEEFYVDKNVLIPQPDTEVLVEQSIKLAISMYDIRKDDDSYTGEIHKSEHGNKKLDILDLCTGSGAIAISLKKFLGNKVNLVASDISPKALEVAKINSKNILNDKETIEFILSDMFKNIHNKYDIIISNPPYIETEVIKTLPLDVQNEPEIALDGGDDGLKFYRIIRENVKDFLKKDGYLIMEIGYNQKDKLLNMFKNATCIKDYSENDRVIIWKKNKRNGE